MKTLRFEGYSDDTFGEYAAFRVDDDDCATGTMRMFRVASGTDELVVCGQYAARGTPGMWMIGVQVVDDDKPLPAWRIWFERSGQAYSPALCIEAPDDVTLTLLKGEEAS
jgi:hypothetical protein